MSYEQLVERVRDACSGLPEAELKRAESVLAICTALSTRPRIEAKLVTQEQDSELKRTLAAAVELLARRESRAIPAATLGRAALADLSGDPRTFTMTCAECEAKLSVLGL